MTIEKRGVMYWINFAILTLLVLPLGAMGVSRFSTVIDLSPESYEFNLVLTYSIIIIVACAFMITGLVFYLLKKLKIFSFMMVGYYLTIIAMFMRGFDRAHKYLFSKYTTIQKMVVIAAILLIILALFNSLVLNGIFNKITTKIVSLVSIILSFACLIYIILFVIVWNARTPEQSMSVSEEFLYTTISVIFFAIPILIASLWVLIMTVRNQFTNFQSNFEKSTDENLGVISEENAELRYCSNCGTQLEEGVAFCPNCGSPCGNLTQLEQQKNDVPSVKTKKNYFSNRIFVTALIVTAFILVIVVTLFVFAPPKPKGLNVSKSSIELNTITGEGIESFSAEYDFGNDNLNEEDINVWYGELKYESNDPEVADVDVIRADGADVVAFGDGECTINIISDYGLRETIHVTVETTLRGLYEEAGCDSSFAEISEDGKTVKIDLSDESNEMRAKSLEAADTFREELGFCSNRKFWKITNPDNWAYDDWAILYGDNGAACEMKFIAAYPYYYSWTLTFSIDD